MRLLCVTALTIRAKGGILNVIGIRADVDVSKPGSAAAFPAGRSFPVRRAALSSGKHAMIKQSKHRNGGITHGEEDC